MSGKTGTDDVDSRPQPNAQSDAVLRWRGAKEPTPQTGHARSAKRGSAPGSRMPYLQAQVVHYRPRVSVLDKELTTVSYHGLVNFLLLLLSATLLRMAIENHLKYGILVSIPGSNVSLQDWMGTLAGMFAVVISFFVAYTIERSAIPSRDDIAGPVAADHPDRGDKARLVGITMQERRTIIMHIFNLLFVLVAPSCLTYFSIFQPALGTLVMALACIMFLKLYSLAATNFDLRRAYCLGDKRLDSDPLRFSKIKNWRFDVSTRNAVDNANNFGNAIGVSNSKNDNFSKGSKGSSSRSSSSSSIHRLSGIGAEVDSVEELIKGIVPRTMRTSFSLNARALDDLHVGGNERIDAKADALPQPRNRHRAASAGSGALRRANTIADSGFSPAASIIDDGTQSDDGASEEAMTSREASVEQSKSDNNSARPFQANTLQSMHKPSSDKAKTASGAGRHQIHYSVAYPNNVTLKNFGYFWLAPTLCYQPSYPRIPGPICKSFLAKRVAEFVIIGIAMYVLIQQYAVPTLVGSVHAIDTGNGFWLSERVLKLSVISASVWFLGFYAIFHAGLNALAEVLRFADRAFYLDWWNSVDLAAYWREWNLPIHYFCKRHIMMPLVSAPLSLPAGVGVMVTFLVSAIMHELLFGIPTHCLKGYSFIGMMMQIPLIQLTQWLVKWRGPDSGLGNAVFWISFCIVGQPLGVVQYYYTWVKNNP
ncbi:hypothetical protein GGI25_003092 [Coemansia spiralis]|uniref:diacylglycerol O-acyltransferase n=2 Tax=Coemansia TaxID=4863 RepID=A0A9W8KYG6_9FUNG|nr:hypothetical protein EDC05_001476 [Coemansia umbellata]KAJ2624366.1 hypothetical protein GGI26_001500 [Coemansia sp. RSA 1358]KAJ2677572.1 hypothetical protein GGI25_003092 [Coemansia spiralis]